MPTDPSTAPATTTRRAFLARAAAGGALVTAGTLASPFASFVPAVGAQVDESGVLAASTFASLATPLELAAVQGYLAALRSELLDEDWTEWARQFQRHHQAVADTLTGLVEEGAATPRASVEFTESITTAIDAAGDQSAVLAALAGVEETLSATHLAAVGLLEDANIARIVTQVLTVEGQQAALLGTASGATLESVTPAKATTDEAVDLEAALEAFESGDEPAESDDAEAPAEGEGDAESTTTTTAGN